MTNRDDYIPRIPPTSESSEANLTAALKNISEQQARIEKYQLTCYKWSVQNHQNIKKIILLLNSISRFLRERFGANTLDATLEEDITLLQLESNVSSCVESFHDVVMRNRHDIESPVMQRTLLNMTADQFNELKEESLEVILPLVSKWASCSDTASFAHVLLIEAASKFPQLFKRPTVRPLLPLFLQSLEQPSGALIDQQMHHELTELKSFLQTCLL